MSIAAFCLSRIVYEGAFATCLKRHTESSASATDCLWSYVDARDVATACEAWLTSDVAGFRAFNVAAADVCVDMKTSELIATHLPHITDLRASFDVQQTPFDSSVLRETLDWKAEYAWQTLRDEGQQAQP